MSRAGVKEEVGDKIFEERGGEVSTRLYGVRNSMEGWVSGRDGGESRL